MEIQNKSKKIIGLGVVYLTVLALSGCGFAGQPDGGVYKSVDGGKIFTQKSFISNKANIASADVLSLEIDPTDSQIIYVGTTKAGIFRTVDGGENWIGDVNNFTEVADIAVSPNNHQIIFIAAVKDNCGKIFKTEDGGGNWSEVYTLNINGPTVSSLAMDRKNPSVLYIGTSNGGMFKTEDGGNTWKSLLWSRSSVRKIAIDKVNSNVVYFGTSSAGALVTKDGGNNFVEIKKSGYVYDILTHPTAEGTVFLSDKEGLQKSTDFGGSWQVINTLVKPENLGSRGLDINPNNPQEIYYASAKAFYKSVNGGISWAPVQFNTTRSIEVIKIDPFNAQNIYLGMYNRKGISGFKLFPG